MWLIVLTIVVKNAGLHFKNFLEIFFSLSWIDFEPQKFLKEIKFLGGGGDAEKIRKPGTNRGQRFFRRTL